MSAMLVSEAGTLKRPQSPLDFLSPVLELRSTHVHYLSESCVQRLHIIQLYKPQQSSAAISTVVHTSSYTRRHVRQVVLRSPTAGNDEPPDS
jgi:hypothetical protein